MVADGVTCTPPVGSGLDPDAVVDLGDGDDILKVPSGTLDGGTGADTMRVSDPAGASTVTYATRTTGVSVTEDGQANDGEPGEHDDVGYGIRAIRGGSGDDVLAGGPTDDVLVGNAGNDRLDGGGDDDIMTGGLGDDVLLGGDGDDYLIGQEGADLLRGGPGKDTTNWAHATRGVHVTLDDRPGDGMPRENDDIGSDVEVLEGTRYGDMMVGSNVPQVLDGWEGDDRLDGGGGEDVISGGPGYENVLVGGPGPDQIVSSGARDTIRTRDGERDQVRCTIPSSSRQRFEVDAVDVVGFCASDLRIAERQRLRLARGGRVAIVAHCPAARGTCAGSLRLAPCRRPRVTLARAGFRIAEGRTRRVRVSLTRTARRLVARRHRVCTTATARSRRTSPPPSAVELTVALTLLA
jgi:Ca2+-binding RTX toxin-like protein